MRSIVITLLIVTISILGCNRDRDGEAIRVNALESFYVFPGDGKVYIQWSIKDEVELPVPESPGPYVYRLRSGGGEEFVLLPNTYYVYLGGYTTKYKAIIDTTVTNGETYKYYVEVLLGGGVPEVVPFYDVSETLAVTPQEGLPDPVPPGPDSIWVTRDGDSHFLLHWTHPSGTDSLYYLLQGPFTCDQLTHWYPSYPHCDQPAYFAEPVYRFPNLRDNVTRHYRVIGFVNGIMTYPAEISVTHN